MPLPALLNGTERVCGGRRRRRGLIRCVPPSLREPSRDMDEYGFDDGFEEDGGTFLEMETA